MTEREALKLAIEYLEDNQHYVADNEAHFYVMDYNNVIEKCKEALAQLEQEPVAWLHTQGNFTEVCIRELDDDEIKRGWTQKPLYTAPPQCKWVGLTEEDVKNFLQASWPREATPADFIRAIETKLKEKNT